MFFKANFFIRGKNCEKMIVDKSNTAVNLVIKFSSRCQKNVYSEFHENSLSVLFNLTGLPAFQFEMIMTQTYYEIFLLRR